MIPWRCETDPVTGDVRWTTEATISSEISENIAWATTKQIPIDPTELVTGEHSGLKILPQQPETNPNLAPALTANGIQWLAADNSRMPEQIAVGSALTVPRYPMNVYFNVGQARRAGRRVQLDLHARADGGSGICEDNPATVTCITPLSTTTGYTSYIVPLETRIALARMLANDPRPHYVHQANITEDRILYPLLDSILGRYRALLAANTPIVNPRLSAAGAELKRQAAWAGRGAGRQRHRVPAGRSGAHHRTGRTGRAAHRAATAAPRGTVPRSVRRTPGCGRRTPGPAPTARSTVVVP